MSERALVTHFERVDINEVFRGWWMSPTRIFGANASVGESMSLVPADESRLAEGRTGYGKPPMARLLPVRPEGARPADIGGR